jgi:glycine cleavage system regulatory protein
MSDANKTDLVLTVIGPDRPGVVSALSNEVTEAGGDWLESRMAALAGQFAGVVRVAVPAGAREALVARLQALATQGLKLVIESGAEPPSQGRMLHIELLGHDRPGIVHELSSLLADNQVSVEELETDTESGAFSGETMFKARACLRVPLALATEALRARLQTLGNELMVDVTLEETGC